MSRSADYAALKAFLADPARPAGTLLYPDERSIESPSIPGKPAEDVAKSWTIPAKYAGYATPNPLRLLRCRY